jgi:excisionase family DNA binding protein
MVRRLAWDSIVVTIISRQSTKNGTIGVGMDKVMTVREVAKVLRIHETTVYRLLRADGIPAFKVGSEWRFSQQAVEAWMKKNTDANES